MEQLLTVSYGDGDILEQMFSLKISALRNHDEPTLWRLTERMVELALASARNDARHHWPDGYVSPSKLFGVPVDYVRDMPHLLYENYMVYPYAVPAPRIHMM
jgi:hypothetical protein